MSCFFCSNKRLSKEIRNLSKRAFSSAFVYIEEIQLSNIYSRYLIDLINDPIYRFQCIVCDFLEVVCDIRDHI
nr:MAG TPA: hypothetical protein [Bacteriophage sp.]DAP28943.1 MAG TPA: hypothetical protein [Caudoviricetes sp.]